MDWTWLAWLLFSFKGRLQRLYWWITNSAVPVVVGALSSAIEAMAQSHGIGLMNMETNEFEPTGLFGALFSVIGLLNLWITYALAAKRLHDRNHRGWWPMAPTVTLLAAILVAVVMFSQPEGQREPCNSAAVILNPRARGLAVPRDRLPQGHRRPKPLRPRSSWSAKPSAVVLAPISGPSGRMEPLCAVGPCTSPLPEAYPSALQETGPG